ncbi:hypothetical protein ABZZ37_16035 [Streptomyces sp. NPDC006464]|uniref:hypothetical protein n=1 Tax=Streptomyces sp. NPDC006464 TaxID=3154305 RepID=UPI00339E08D5
MTAQWYVLIEEDTRATKRVDGTDLKLHHWKLVGTHPIHGTEAQAHATAEDAALHYTPALLARHTRPGDEPARHAFLTPDGAWLVHLKQRHRECHIRVTTARLIHALDEKQAPTKTLKDKLRGALEGPPPPNKPWRPRKQA